MTEALIAGFADFFVRRCWTAFRRLLVVLACIYSSRDTGVLICEDVLKWMKKRALTAPLYTAEVALLFLVREALDERLTDLLDIHRSWR